MKRMLVVGAAIAASGFVSGASAADMPAKAPVYKAPMAAPLYNWTGSMSASTAVAAGAVRIG